jgi:predicted nuclease of predicted toxin-antitoxin system
VKLLFDENLSHKLAHRVADIFPDSIHVRDVGLKSSDDPLVWDYAKENDFMIVSKDTDMHDLSLVFGNPPKVVWIRLGNCTTSDVEDLLRRDFDVIKLFYTDGNLSLLDLS